MVIVGFLQFPQAIYLDESPHRLAVGWDDVLLISVHDLIPLSPCQVVLGQMQVDLISIKVSVEGVTVGVVHANDPFSLCHKPTPVSIRCDVMKRVGVLPTLMPRSPSC